MELGLYVKINFGAKIFTSILKADSHLQVIHDLDFFAIVYCLNMFKAIDVHSSTHYKLKLPTQNTKEYFFLLAREKLCHEMHLSSSFRK